MRRINQNFSISRIGNELHCNVTACYESVIELFCASEDDIVICDLTKLEPGDLEFINPVGFDTWPEYARQGWISNMMQAECFYTEMVSGYDYSSIEMLFVLPGYLARTFTIDGDPGDIMQALSEGLQSGNPQTKDLAANMLGNIIAERLFEAPAFLGIVFTPDFEVPEIPLKALKPDTLMNIIMGMNGGCLQP